MKRRGASRGFALLIVIWGLGIISLLVVSFMTTGRLRLQSAVNVAGGARATAIVEGATNLAIMQLIKERESRLAAPSPNVAAAPTGLDPQRPVYDGAPHFCSFDGAAVLVAVEDEGGKIDLNAATPEMLSIILQALGEGRNRADQVAAAILAFRTVQQQQIGASQSGAPTGGRPFPPKFALFQTVLELDQVAGVDPKLYRRFSPLLTVYSRNPTINPRAAPPALFAALVGAKPEEVDALLAEPFPNRLNREDPRFPAQFKGQGEGEAYLIRVEALLPGGYAGGRETIIDFSTGSATPVSNNTGVFGVKEIRRSPSRHGEQLRQLMAGGAALRPC